MKMVELGKCCKIISGSTPSRIVPEYWNGDIHWFTPKDFSGLSSKYILEAPEKITDQGFRSCSTNLIPAYSLLFSSRAPIGHIGINRLECCTNQGFKSLVPNENLDVEYLYYAIKRIVPQLQDMGNGATFKELSKSSFEKVLIPLPPLATQKRLAAILDAADLYRQTTRALVAKYDQLAQSLFLEMFGDPVRNEKGYEITTFERIATQITDGDHLTPIRESSGYKLLSCRNIKNGYIDFEAGVDYVGEAEYQRMIKRCKPDRNDILISCSGTIGRTTAIKIDEPIVLVRSAALVKLKKDLVTPLFIEFYLRTSYMQMIMMKNANTSSQSNLFSGPIKRLPVLIPPLALQTQFAARIQLIEAQKQQALSALQKSEMLFNSLLQKAFKGELVS